MSLRTRLLIGYGYLVLLLLVAVGSGIGAFNWLAEATEDYSETRIERVRSTIEIASALEARRTAISEEAETGGDRQLEQFHRGLEDEIGDLTELYSGADSSGIRSSLEALQRNHSEFQNKWKQYRHSPSRQTRSKLLSRLDRMRDVLGEILHREDESTTRIQEEIETITGGTKVWFGVLAAIGLISLVVLARELHSRVLEPLDEIRDVTEAIARGDQKRRISVLRDDELGSIARHFNDIVDAKQAATSKLEGRFNRQRQLLSGMLENSSDWDALARFDGEILAESRRFDGDLQKEIGEWIRTEGRELAKSGDRGEIPETVEFGTFSAKIQLLRTRTGRPVGWVISANSP